MIHSGGAFFSDYFGPIHYEPDALLLRVRGNPYKLQKPIPSMATCCIIEGCCGGSIRLSYPVDARGNAVVPGSEIPIERIVFFYCIEVLLPNPKPIEFVSMNKAAFVEYEYGSKVLTVIQKKIAKNVATLPRKTRKAAYDEICKAAYEENDGEEQKRHVYYLKERLPDGIRCVFCELPDGNLWLTFTLKNEHGKMYGSRQVIASSTLQSKGCEICCTPIFTRKECPLCDNDNLRPKFGEFYSGELNPLYYCDKCSMSVVPKKLNP